MVICFKAVMPEGDLVPICSSVDDLVEELAYMLLCRYSFLGVEDALYRICELSRIGNILAS